jgi:hypothetical protein
MVDKNTPGFRIYFEKTFGKGHNLEGLTVREVLFYPNERSARAWIRAMDGKTIKDYPSRKPATIKVTEFTQKLVGNDSEMELKI